MGDDDDLAFARLRLVGDRIQAGLRARLQGDQTFSVRHRVVRLTRLPACMGRGIARANVIRRRSFKDAERAFAQARIGFDRKAGGIRNRLRGLQRTAQITRHQTHTARRFQALPGRQRLSLTGGRQSAVALPLNAVLTIPHRFAVAND